MPSLKGSLGIILFAAVVLAFALAGNLVGSSPPDELQAALEEMHDTHEEV